MSINWKDHPFYNHEGRWVKKYQSIMDPMSKVTWPQLIAEFVVYWRIRCLKDYPKVNKGKGWSNSIQKQVRDLNQQAAAICGYFPHPDDEPLVLYAVKKYFREHKPLKIGQFRKVRTFTKNGRECLNITQAEKDVVLGINAELMKVMKTRDSFSIAAPATDSEKINTFNTNATSSKKKGSLSFLIELEKELKAQQVNDKDE